MTDINQFPIPTTPFDAQSLGLARVGANEDVTGIWAGGAALTRAALKARSVAGLRDGDPVELAKNDRGGSFYWDSTVTPAERAEDPFEGMLIKPDSVDAGDPGAYRRNTAPYSDSYVSGTWFGLSEGREDNDVALQAASDWLYWNGGGVIGVPVGTFTVSDETYIWQRVTLRGFGAGFISQFVTDAAKPKGSVIFLKSAAGLSAGDAVIRFRLKGEWDAVGGFFRDAPIKGQSVGDRNSDYRHHGKIESITVWGNRSQNLNPTIKDLNANGHNISIDGARYVSVLGVRSMFAPQRGLNCSSFDYGGGTIPSNNINVSEKCAFLSNADGGANLAGGDSIFIGNSVGFNGSTGLSISAWGQVVGNLVWDNVGHGISISPTFDVPTIVGNKIYDNQLSGVFMTSTGILVTYPAGDPRDPFTAYAGVTLVGNTIVRNRRSAVVNPPIADRCGVYIGSPRVNNIVIVGNRIGNDDAVNPNTQDYGVYFNSADTRCQAFEGNDIAGNRINNLVLASPDNIRFHSTNTGSNRPEHPGFKATGSIDAGGNDILNVRALSASVWGPATFDTGVLALGVSGFVSANITGGGTVTDVTATTPNLPIVVIRNANADPLIFANSSTKLRLINQRNVTLNQHDCIVLQFVSGTVWQQIGGKFALSLGNRQIATNQNTSIAVQVTPTTLFAPNIDGAVWHVYLAHNAGNTVAECVVRGSSTAPGILRQSTEGARTVTFSISGTNLQAALDSSSITASYYAYRVV
jgi:hypothetical protein